MLVLSLTKRHNKHRGLLKTRLILKFLNKRREARRSGNSQWCRRRGNIKKKIIKTLAINENFNDCTSNKLVTKTSHRLQQLYVTICRPPSTSITKLRIQKNMFKLQIWDYVNCEAREWECGRLALWDSWSKLFPNQCQKKREKLFLVKEGN